MKAKIKLNSRGKPVGPANTPTIRQLGESLQPRWIHHLGLAKGVPNPSCGHCHGTGEAGTKIFTQAEKDHEGKITKPAHKVPMTCSCVMRQINAKEKGIETPWEKRLNRGKFITLEADSPSPTL